MKRFLLLALILSLTFSGAALGDTYGQLVISSVSSTEPNISISAGPVTGTYRGDYDVYVQSVDATGQSFGFGGLAGAWHEVYCVDLVDHAATGTYVIKDLQDLAQVSVAEASLLRKMVTVVGGVIGGTEAAKANQQAAAWEIIYESLASKSLSTGTFKVSGIGSGGSVTAANAILAAITPGTVEAEVFGLYNAVTQDWGIVVKGGGQSEGVPEPSTMVGLLGLAMAGALGYARRRKS